ncbi:MAG: FAD-dependent oxidoreductase [Clostridia bacterium]|nr:FAD-dependent oxidoreductase [Clostridia bacterium]
MKRAIGVLVCLCMLIGMTQAAFAQGIYTPGEYSASAYGFGGMVDVTVTVDDGSIISVEAVGDSETTGIGSMAIEQLPAAIVAANGIDVDGVSGASITSAAIIEAASQALSQASGTSSQSAISFIPGTYTGTGDGYNGDIELSVTFTEDAITAIEVVNSSETDHVGTSAYIIFDDIMAFTSTGVDVISGATFTSRAILEAVNDAAQQAGCDISAIQAGAVPFAYTPQEKIVDTYDVVIIGAGGAGMAAAAQAAQNGSTVLVIEKNAEMGGNTLVSGGSFQAVVPEYVFDPENPEATQAYSQLEGIDVIKSKSDAGRIATLNTILNWSEEPFDGHVEDPEAIKTVDDYDLPNRGVHAEYLQTLQTLKGQIAAYMEYANAHLAAGELETDLTVFSTVELHIFQTYYGGLRLSNDKTKWIYSDYELVKQMCEEAYDLKPWLQQQGVNFNFSRSTATLIGCLWQRINSVSGATVDGETYNRNWGAYFKAPESTLLKANEKNRIMTRTTATGLIVDETGAVTGVNAVMYDGTQLEITAAKGVIIATGGYGANIDMVLETNEYWNDEDLSANIETTNRNSAMGDGIIMAQEVGADIAGTGWTQLMPLGWVDNGDLAGGSGENVIYISPAGHENAGKRYVDESAERDVLSQGAYDYGTEDGVYIELSNGDSSAGSDDVEGRRYIRTLEGAAELLGIDADTLEKTITDYDMFVIGATDEAPVPSKNAYRGTIGTCDVDENGNYIVDSYRIEWLCVRYLAPSTHHTMGGIVVDIDRKVLDTQGEAIKGLYAAGEVTSGFFAGNRLGGNAVTEILVSGRVAANSATEQ